MVGGGTVGRRPRVASPIWVGVGCWRRRKQKAWAVGWGREQSCVTGSGVEKFFSLGA
jgi:hypothetical protein